MTRAKTLMKILALVLIVAAAAGVVTMVKKSKDASPVSYDQWPDVAENPATV
jgi:hypothetical protein